MASRLRATTIVTLLLLGTGLGSAPLVRAAAPAVSSMGPSEGPPEGGTAVAISGSGFSADSTVAFGRRSAARVRVRSASSMTAVSPSGSGAVAVKVSNSKGVSRATRASRFTYLEAEPAEGPWLGLNGNSSGLERGEAGRFAAHGIAYDRGGPIEWMAGEQLAPGGREGKGAQALSRSIEMGMIPIVTIEYEGYRGHWGEMNLPTGARIAQYVSGFISSAREILARHPGQQVLFEPINEPWGYGSAEQYAAIIAALLPAAEREGIPLGDIYVGAYGKRWVARMYQARPALETEIQGWYLHPYGPPRGALDEYSAGIQSLPHVRAEMTSGQDNLIVSEIGYCTADVNGGENCFDSPNPPSGAQAAQWLTETLETALVYHEAGWLRALLVYSRSDGGWAMERASGRLTAQGRALEAFAERFGSSGEEPAFAGGLEPQPEF